MPGDGLSRTGMALLTTFGLGLRRPAPGTWGSMPPVALAWALAWGLSRCEWGCESSIDGWPAGAWLTYHGVLMAVLGAFGLACLRYGDAAEARFNAKDPGSVCADETAGVCLPLMALPAAAISTPASLALMMVAAFLAFRVMDILKLPPARGLQSFPGGLGILIDDLIAGVQALVLVQLLARLVVVPNALHA